MAVTQVTGTGGEVGSNTFPTNQALSEAIYRVSSVFFLSFNWERLSLFFPKVDDIRQAILTEINRRKIYFSLLKEFICSFLA